jgi:hypothetical protein
MSDRAIASGLYMRTLSRREAVAHMASTIVDFLIGERRYEEAIEVAGVILEHSPRDGYTLVKLGSAYGEIIRTEIIDMFPTAAVMPPVLRQRYMALVQQNRAAFRAAEALGWEPPG